MPGRLAVGAALAAALVCGWRLHPAGTGQLLAARTGAHRPLANHTIARSACHRHRQTSLTNHNGHQLLAVCQSRGHDSLGIQPLRAFPPGFPCAALCMVQDDQEATTLLSALSVALRSAAAPWPAFVPLHNVYRCAATRPKAGMTGRSSQLFPSLCHAASGHAGFPLHSSGL